MQLALSSGRLGMALSVGLAVAALAACGERAGPRTRSGPASAAELHRASLLRADVALAVVGAPDEDAALLTALARRLAQSSSGRTLPSGARRAIAVVADPADAAPDALRIVCASTRNAELAALFAAAGIEPRPDGFRFGDDLYLRATDAVIATIEDPERPGCPLSLAVGNTAAAALAHVASAEPTARRSYRTFRSGLPERSGALDPDGGLDPRGEQPIGRRRAELLGAHETFDVDELLFKVPVAGTRTGAGASGQRRATEADPGAEPQGYAGAAWVAASGLAAELARARAALAASWPAAGEAAQREREILVVCHAHLEDKRAASNDGRAASVERVAGRIDVTASPAGRAQASAAWIEAALAARLGPVDPDWTRAAFASELADQVRDAPATDRAAARDASGVGTPDLAARLARLERAGLVPNLATLLDARALPPPPAAAEADRTDAALDAVRAAAPGSRSPRVLADARAGLVRFLRARDAAGPEVVRALVAEGPATLAAALDDELERAWRAWLTALPSAVSTESALGGPRRGSFAVEGEAFIGGLHVVAPRPSAPGYATRACDASLAAARAAGARAVAFTLFEPVDAGEPILFGVDPRSALAADEAALAHALERARELGLATFVSAHVPASPSTTWSTWMPHPGSAPWNDAFDELEAALVHVALVAEAGGCDLLGLGSGLATATASRARHAPGAQADAQDAEQDAEQEGKLDAALYGDPASRADGGRSAKSEQRAQANRAVAELRLTRWRGLVRSVRAVFDGALTYGANDVGELVAIEFWEDLDYVGLDLFTSLAEGGDRRDRLGAAPLFKRFVNVLARLRSVAARNGRPALITALGLPSTDGSWEDTRWLSGEVDLDAQAAALETLAAAVRYERERSDRLQGLFLWRWTTDPAGGGAVDRSWTVQNKPAERVLPELFAR